MDRDNFISNGELFLVLKMMVGNNLKVRTPPMQWPTPRSETLIDRPVRRTHNCKRSSTRQ